MLYKIGFVLLAVVSTVYYFVSLGKKSERVENQKEKLAVAHANMKTMKERQRKQDANKKIPDSKSVGDAIKRLLRH